MQKVLPGSSRVAIKFILKDWLGLLKISVVPFFMLFVIGLIQLYKSQPFLLFYAAMIKADGKLDATTSSELMKQMYGTYAIGVVGLFILFWLFVKTANLYRSHNRTLIGTAEQLGMTFRVIFHFILIVLLTAAFVAALFLVFYILGSIFDAVLGSVYSKSAEPNLIVIGLLIYALMAALFVAMAWLFGKFSLSLPAAAIGETQKPFGALWATTKGESWGLPIRFIVWGVVGMIPLMIVSRIFMAALMERYATQLVQQSLTQVPSDMMHQFIVSILPLQLLHLTLQFPLIWFFSILLVEVFSRFVKKTQQ